jgi:hypothetical protein
MLMKCIQQPPTTVNSVEPVFTDVKNEYLNGIVKIFADGGYR